MQDISSLWWQAAGLVFSGIAIISAVLASLMWLLRRFTHKTPSLFLVSSCVAIVFYAVVYRTSAFNLLDTLPFLEVTTLVLLAIGVLVFIIRLVKLVKRENEFLEKRMNSVFGQRVKKGVN